MKAKYFTFFIFIVLAVTTIGVASVSADKYGLFETANKAGLPQYSTNPLETAGNVIGTILSLVGVLFFGLMIFGGFLWMTAHGKEDQEKRALETITAAVIGILIILGSYAVTNLVFKSVGKKPAGQLDAPPGKEATEMGCYCSLAGINGSEPEELYPNIPLSQCQDKSVKDLGDLINCSVKEIL